MLRLIGGVVLCAVVSTTAAQIAPARTWPELKQATQDRVDGQRYPLTGFDPVEVREILGRIQSLGLQQAWFALQVFPNKDALLIALCAARKTNELMEARVRVLAKPFDVEV